MKGITHFLFGVAMASIIAALVRLPMDQAYLILLGGVFGVLPDTLDFKFARYIEVHDKEVQPDAADPDPSVITDAMVDAIEETDRTGRTTKVKIHTVKVGGDLWRRFSILIDTKNKQIVSRIGPLVTTGQVPLPYSEPEGDRAVSVCSFSADLDHTYEAENNVDIFSGPDYAFVKDGDKVRVDFIPWHRRWSHSLTVGLLLAPVGLLLFGLTPPGIVACTMIVAGFWGHVFVDQLGVLGSNLFFPFTRDRSNGMGFFHSGGTLPNFFTNYISVGIVIWCLDALSPTPRFSMTLPIYIVAVMVLPMVAIYVLSRIWARFEELRDEREARLEEQMATGGAPAAIALGTSFASACTASSESWADSVRRQPVGSMSRSRAAALESMDEMSEDFAG